MQRPFHMRCHTNANPTMHLFYIPQCSIQKYANLCSEWSFVGYWTDAFRDLWTRSILPIFSGCFRRQCDGFSVGQWSHTENIWKWTGSTAVILITKTKIYTKTKVFWEVLHVKGLVDCNISIAHYVTYSQAISQNVNFNDSFPLNGYGFRGEFM